MAETLLNCGADPNQGDAPNDVRVFFSSYINHYFIALIHIF